MWSARRGYTCCDRPCCIRNSCCRFPNSDVTCGVKPLLIATLLLCSLFPVLAGVIAERDRVQGSGALVLTAFPFGPSGVTPTPSPGITVVPSAVTFTATRGGQVPANQTILVTTSNGANWSSADTSPFFDSNPHSNIPTASGTLSTLIPNQPGIQALAPGTYTQTITYSSPGFPNRPVVVTLILSAGATPGPTAIPSPTPVPPVIPLVSVRLTWGNAITAARLNLYDCQSGCIPPNYPNAVLLRQIGVTTRPNQQLTLISTMPRTNMLPGSQHIYLMTSVDAAGTESVFSNAAPWTVPVLGPFRPH